MLTPTLTLHPLADLNRRYHEISPNEIEADMTTDEGRDIALGPLPERDALWWEVRNYASAMYLTHHTLDALHFARRAVQMRPCVSTFVPLSVIEDELGCHEDALESAERAYRSDPRDDRASARYGELLLRAGRFAEGWPLWTQNRAAMDWVKPFLPEWQGPHQPVRGKRILVIEGGGYGDNIYFLRWLHTLRQWGARLHYICQPDFASLVRRQKHRAVENWQGNIDVRWDSFDYFLPLLSVAGKLGVTLDNYRWTGPYIRAARRRPFFRTRKLGLCFKAGEGKAPRKQRTLHNEQIQRLIDATPKGWTLYNMAHGTWHPDIESRYHTPMLEGDWLHTANVLSQLDLLITVDTGIAHLAGAMGIPTWVILPGSSAWNYPLGHDTHPFYPSMRIFRNPGEYLESAVTEVEERLMKL